MKNKFLLAISGGVDSMVLLNEYKTKNIIVAFVNYNIREEAALEQQIVESFCDKNNIKFYIKSISQNYEGNFQNWAREERYKFFKKIYDLENCSKLLIAHHKDDFLETYFLNKRSKRRSSYLGIKKNNNLFGMNIERPFVNKYYKKKLYKKAEKENIPFNDDKSNFETKYTRNKIRKELKNWTIMKKELFFWKIKIENFFLQFKTRKLKKIYNKWEEEEFNIFFLKNNEKFIDDLIFNYLVENYQNINISKNKINSVKDFIFAKNEAKKIELGKSFFLYKDNKKIYNFLNE